MIQRMINFTIYPPKEATAFHIFDFPIRFYGIIITVSIFCGIFCAYYLIKQKYNKDFADLFLDYSPMVIISAIVGARLFYIIGDFKYYFHNPSEIIMINHGGLSIWGGIALGIAALFFYSKKYNINFLKNLDIFALFMPLCQAIGRWGNYFNQEAYGKPYNGFLKYYIDENHRYPDYKRVEFYHPTFLYEMILDLILFVILFLIFKKSPKNGSITCLYLILYGIVRIIIEQLRIDSVCYLFNIPIATFLSVVAISIAVFVLIKIQK